MISSRGEFGSVLIFTAAVALACAAPRTPRPAGPGTAAPTAEARIASRVDEYIRAQMVERRIPGLALVVVRDGATVFMQGYGVGDVENAVPVTAETVFDISSITKTFTASAIMRLADSGRLDIDRPVRAYLPDAPESWTGMTVRHLLTHTAGLSVTDVPTVSGAWLADYTTSQMLAHAFSTPLVREPGAGFLYSDLGYFLLGAIVERVTGTRYGEFLRETFFAPFEMRATRMLDQYEIVPHKAGTYFLREQQLVRNRRYVQVELSSAYGVLTSAQDFARWESAVARGQVVSPTAMAEMERPARTSDGTELSYGLGWVVGALSGNRTVGHAGGTGAYYLRLPEQRLSIIVLTNLAIRTLQGGRVRQEGSNPRVIAETVADMYLTGSPRAERP